MRNGIVRYRNLADWSHGEWQDLDIHLFIAANFNRYCSGLIKKIGLQYLPSDATDSLLGLFCDVAYKPLSTVHTKNLNAKGERRNQIMLGTLKMIAYTRMVQAVIKEFPSYIAIEHITFSTEDEGLTEPLNNSTQPEFAPLHIPSSESAFFAAETMNCFYEESERQLQRESDRVSVMVEILRGHLTPVQYKHLRYSVCDGLDPHEISLRTGHSVTNVRIMLLNARKKMMELVPMHLLDSVQDCLHRK